MSTCLVERRSRPGLQTILPSPRELRETLPASGAARETVRRGRQRARAILERRDGRLLAIVGPCSIHDSDAAVEYARRLRSLARRCADRLCLLMRVYLEKPRTTVGWRGLLVDPRLDGSGGIDEGLREGRRLLLRIAELGIPAATELLDPLLAPSIQDLVSWAAIGARTAASQIHRELASDLPMPVGFKNTTDGNVRVAVDGMVAAARPWRRVALDDEGRPCARLTAGNDHPHLVLRGSCEGCNCDERGLLDAAALLQERGFPPLVIVDCSHGNSGGDAGAQAKALRTALAVRHPRAAIVAGFMLESNLAAGRQRCERRSQGPDPRLSITDACLGWQETEEILLSVCEEARR